MRNDTSEKPRNRDNEKGAALVMALLVSSLLLVASVGLLMETTTNTENVTDAIAEQEAYNAAESGIQAAVFVLRDNVTLSDANRIDPTKPVTHRNNRIDYLKAISIDKSNSTTSGLDLVPRLSRWMTYDATAPDRVKLGEGTYVAQNGYAYKLEMSDPDHTGALVTFATNGRFYDFDAGDRTQKTYGDATNGFVIKYIRRTPTTIDTTGGAASTDFGTFRLTKYGNGAQIPAFNRFEIVTTMTVPYAGVRVLRGFIESNTCVSGVCSTPKIITDSKTFTLQGSFIDLEFGGTFITNTSVTPVLVGYEATMSYPDTVLTGTMSSPEPIRLLIKSTGYGPRGSMKQLEAIIQKNFFNGLTAPATLTLIGPRTTTNPATSFTFNPGSSNVTTYTGVDVVSTDVIPPIGTSNDANLNDVYDSVDGLPPHPFNGDVVGVPTNISEETPDWLSSPAALDAAVKSLYDVANSRSRYFPNGTQPTSFGNHTTGEGITFCDGNCDLSGEGGGILVVTGKLTLKGNFSFKGLIIVTGQDGVDRQGGGDGTIEGNIVVAPYVNSPVLPASNPVGTTFLAPKYDLSGGGNSTIAYNSSALTNGLSAVDNFILGVVEK